jgi:hypothetical protein
MSIFVQILSGRQTTWPRGSRGMRRHAESWPAGHDFYHCRPLLALIGRAVVIAEVLRECEYLRCIADVVTAQLVILRGEHGVSRRFGVGSLSRTGRRA